MSDTDPNVITLTSSGLMDVVAPNRIRLAMSEVPPQHKKAESYVYSPESVAFNYFGRSENQRWRYVNGELVCYIKSAKREKNSEPLIIATWHNPDLN